MSEQQTVEHPWLEHIEASLYLQKFPKKGSDEDLTSMLAAVEKLIFSMKSPYAWVVDLGVILMASAYQRRLFAEHENRTKEHDRQFNAGSALYVHSPFASGLVTAVFWLSPPAYPTKVTTGIREAERWARLQLKERGVDIGLEPTLSIYRTFFQNSGRPLSERNKRSA